MKIFKESIPFYQKVLIKTGYNHQLTYMKDEPKINKYSCSGLTVFKSQRVKRVKKYYSNQKLLHHYQHSKYQLNSYIHF